MGVESIVEWQDSKSRFIHWLAPFDVNVIVNAEGVLAQVHRSHSQVMAVMGRHTETMRRPLLPCQIDMFWVDSRSYKIVREVCKQGSAMRPASYE